MGRCHVAPHTAGLLNAPFCGPRAVGRAPSMLHVHSGGRERQREDHAEHETSPLPTLKGRAPLQKGVHSRRAASTPEALPQPAHHASFHVACQP